MKIIVFPLDWNPYQRLLYDAMLEAEPGLKIRRLRRYPVIGALLLPWQLLVLRCAGYRVLHLHWPAFTIDIPRRYEIQASSALARLSLATIARLRLRLVWTVHNVVPHQRETTDDIALARQITRCASALIVHSSSTVQDLIAAGCEVGSTTVIPHGNYEGVYPATESASVSRAALGVDPGAVVVLFFGTVRPYKGVEKLVVAADGLAGITVVVAGAGSYPALDAALAESVVPCIRLPDRIAEHDVGALFAASDLVCLPFDSVTTSGSALLALTLGRPIVAPATGGLRDLPADVGWLYDPLQPDALRAALEEAVSDPIARAERARGAQRYADSLSWPAIAARTRALYDP